MMWGYNTTKGENMNEHSDRDKSEAEVERWKAKYREEFMRAQTLEERLDESVPVHTGWRGYDDGSRSPVERWVRASNGDWVSLDSTRRTSRDIIPQHFSSVPDWKARAEAVEVELAETRQCLARVAALTNDATSDLPDWVCNVIRLALIGGRAR
jgi:hypothetical protein